MNDNWLKLSIVGRREGLIAAAIFAQAGFQLMICLLTLYVGLQ
jgi:hypothetical protein